MERARAIRIAGFVVLASVAIASYLVLTPRVAHNVPTLPSSTQYTSLITGALSDYDLNNASAESAPQQDVVNGWVAKDLLSIVAKELADVLTAQGAVVDATGNLQTQPFDERIPALLLIGILAILWSALTQPNGIQAPRAQQNGSEYWPGQSATVRAEDEWSPRG